MPQLHRFILHPLTSKVFVGLLAGAYIVYLGAFVHNLTASSQPASQMVIVEHTVDTNLNAAVSYWTVTNMLNATDVDQQLSQTSDVTQMSSDTSAGKAAQQTGQPPLDSSVSYPLSTVGKLFFSSSSGQNLVCSGTAVTSNNKSVVDTAGHCLYWQGGWVQNVIFCPLFDHGTSPYGCWAARDLAVPAEWINGGSTAFARDFGMAVVAPNDQGALTDVVGGAGWAYNQPIKQLYYPYGYPAAPPFDGQSRQFCEGALGTSWLFGGGTVISVPCNMTGGSSGGPWFIKIGGVLYLSGHNDFTSTIKQGHMFSPYYDDTWYALYSKAQQS
ncbi:MAG TPA: hypothetical protein VGT44_09765 [Ktedonobacteraceae bacterium]|nr:hypothetical protein [Ktedonobacteraceae bacterium]